MKEIDQIYPLTINDKIKLEKRKRNQVYSAINYLKSHSNKFDFFSETINNTFLKSIKNEFIQNFCKIQQTYNGLKKLFHNYKYKKGGKNSTLFSLAKGN